MLHIAGGILLAVLILGVIVEINEALDRHGDEVYKRLVKRTNDRQPGAKGPRYR